MSKNFMLPEKAIVSSLAAGVNGYSPLANVKVYQKELVVESGEITARSLAVDRGGIYLRGILVDYNYFMIDKVFRLGYVLNSLLDCFGVSGNSRMKSKYLLMLWTDQLTEIELLYPNRKGSINIYESKRSAQDQFVRICKVLQWIKTLKNYLLKNGTSKEIRPILSEYVLSAGTPLSTLQSEFLSSVQK